MQRRRVEFGDRLWTLGLRAGLTHETVATSATLDRSFSVEVENGRHSVLLDRVFQIADALDVSTADLFVADPG